MPEKEHQTLSFSHGFLIPKPAHILGYLLLIVGFFTIMESIAVGLVCFAIYGFINLSFYGVSFNPEEKLIQNYMSFFYLKFGKWESYEAYTDMALLSQRVVSTTYSRANISTSSREVKHELYLLTPDHRKKILIVVFKNAETAERAKPETLAEKLGVNFTTYAPVISEKTRIRRRK